MRFIRAVRAYNRERRTEIKTVVFYTEPDVRARFVCEADDAVNLGGSTFVDPLDGYCKPSYLDYPRLERTLLSSGVDAVWVGWGFVSERPEFADLCARLGLVFIGPASETMRRLGDKISAKRLAEQIGVPVIPWGGGPADSVEIAREQARSLGYPVVIKATAGEGGRGIRRVDSDAELAGAFAGVQSESRRLFGNPSVYIEKWMDGARHVEAQIVADSHGTTWALGLRDCSIQRRHQKIVEEAPADVLPPAEGRDLCAAAIHLCQAAGYRNAGTVEFLYDPATQRFGLMEVNVRLQVEHAVTELTTGLDLVQLQLHVAMGGRLDGEPPVSRGHAVEVRLNAEDADNAFAPAPGRVDLFRVPSASGLRLDSGVIEGDHIPADFDSMFAKLICYGQTRAEALSGLAQALEDSAIVIAGGVTNRAFLLQLLERDEVQRDKLDVGWLDRQRAVGGHVSALYADFALLQAAIDVYEAEFEVEREQFLASAARMRPVIRTETGRSVELRHRGHLYKLHVYRHCSHHYRVDVDGLRIDVEIDRGGRFEQWLSYAGKRHRVVSVVQGLTHLIEVDGALHKISRDESGIIRSCAPSVVVSVDVKPGDRVLPGTRLALLEAMKMEMPILAPFAGTVREVLVLNNSQVGTGAALLKLDLTDAGKPVTVQSRVLFRCASVNPPGAGDASARMHEVFADLRHLMLGSDIHPADARLLVEEYTRLCSKLPVSHEELIRIEDEILSIFVDVSSLFRRQAIPQDPDDAELLSSGEYLLTYLRTMDTLGSSLPSTFIGKLQRALRHYGSSDLHPTPALKGRLLWIYKSHHQMDQQVPAIMAVLERRLNNAEELWPRLGREFLMMLDRLLMAAEGRFPALCDLVRDARYRYFELPVFESARRTICEQMDDHLAYLAGNPHAEDREARIKVLVACPYPLMNLLSSRFTDAGMELRRLMLEVLTRRHYRIRNLENFHAEEVNGRCYAIAEYKHDGRRLHLISTHSEEKDLDGATAGVRQLLKSIPEGHEVVIDLCGWRDDLSRDPDEVAAELHEMIRHSRLDRIVRRIAVSLTGPEGLHGVVRTQHFTFRPFEGDYREEKIYRGLHPMMSKRLQLWRLQNFNIERLPSVEDIYLFRGVAVDNPKDERLFAIAEVRDLTPVRGSDGRVVQLPHLEHMLVEALAAIRQVQLKRTPEERLHWNRVLLHVWPDVDLQDAELQSIARRLARQTEGLGLEKVVLRVKMVDPYSDELLDTVLSIANPAGRGIVLRYTPPTDQPVRPLSEYVQ
ncbi:MAG TPA: biotin carboxylase N-terminal domain-containing protein, partial [Acidobacteriota bacterium]|nr:biotin carboxylase N-terminal domain-containing protein [Acidobacteriota bacterium]